MKLDKDGNLVIDLVYLFDNMSDECKLRIAERLSCEEVIIKHVTDQIFDGLTENGYCGGEVIDQQRLGTALQDARERIRKEGNRLLVEELSRLRRELENRRGYMDAGWNKYHELYNKVYGSGINLV